MTYRDVYISDDDCSIVILALVVLLKLVCNLPKLLKDKSIKFEIK